MKKKTSLTAALSDAPSDDEDFLPKPLEKSVGRVAEKRPDRAGKTNVTGYFEKPVKWELQDLATERSRELGRKVTVQELLGEALNDLFKKYGKAEVVRQE